MRSIFASTFALLLLLGSLAQAAPAFDTVVPDKALVFARVKNLPELETKIKAHPIHGLWMEPGVQQFLQKPLARLNESIQKAEGKAGVKAADIWGVLRGEIALYVTYDEAKQLPAVMLLVNVADQGPKAMEMIDTIVTAIGKEAGNAPRKVENTIEGVKFITLRDQQEGADDAEKNVSYGVVNDVLVVGGPFSAIQQQVALLKAPPAQALAGNAAYKNAMSKITAESDAGIYVNVAEAIALAQRAKGDPKTAQIFNALGLNTFTSAAAGFELGKEYDQSRIYIGHNGTPTGIAKILSPAPGALHTGAEVPADVAGFMTARFDPPVIWDEVERILNNIDPNIVAMINGQMNMAAQQLGQPLSLRNDILGVFGPRLALYTRYEQPFNLMTSQQIVVMLDITSKAAFQGLMDKIQKAFPQVFAFMQPRDYMGNRIYVLGPPQEAGVQQPEGMPKPALAATEKQLIFSTRVENVEAYLRQGAAQGPSLETRAEFQELLKTLPAEGRVMVQFSDARQQVAYFIGMLKGGQFDMFLQMMKQDPDVAAFVDLFDFTLLPDAAIINKYVSPGVGCALAQPDGLLILGKSPVAKPAAK